MLNAALRAPLPEDERFPDHHVEEVPRLARRPPASGARTALRPRRWASTDAGRDRRGLQTWPV